MQAKRQPALNPDGRLEIFVIAADNQLYHRWQTTAGSSSTWSAWTSLGGNLVGDPAVALNSDGRLEVFAVSAVNNQLYHIWQTTAGSTTAWSAWTCHGDPAVARNNDGILEVFVIGANGNALFNKWQNTAGTTTNSWSAFQSLGGNIKSSPAVAVNSDGRLEVFAVSASNELYITYGRTHQALQPAGQHISHLEEQ